MVECYYGQIFLLPIKLSHLIKFLLVSRIQALNYIIAKDLNYYGFYLTNIGIEDFHYG